MNIFEALRESHELQRHLALSLIQTRGDCPERTERYQALKKEIFAHELAEERHLYAPMLVDDMGMNPTRHALAEHHKLDEIIEDLDKLELSSPAWLPLAKKLSEKVHHHLQEEEKKFFQLAGKILSEKQKKELAEAYLKTYRKALKHDGKTTH
jgi:hypothetical protein